MTTKPAHPGEVLQDEFLAPLNLSAGALAKACGVPRPRIEKIVSQRIGVEAGTALRLAKALGTTPEFWLDLQTAFDLHTARHVLDSALNRIARVT